MAAMSKSARADLDGADLLPNILTDSLPMQTHAAFRSNDFTKPPTYDLTAIWPLPRFSISSGASRFGGR